MLQTCCKIPSVYRCTQYEEVEDIAEHAILIYLYCGTRLLYFTLYPYSQLRRLHRSADAHEGRENVGPNRSIAGQQQQQ